MSPQGTGLRDEYWGGCRWMKFWILPNGTNSGCLFLANVAYSISCNSKKMEVPKLGVNASQEFSQFGENLLKAKVSWRGAYSCEQWRKVNPTSCEKRKIWHHIGSRIHCDNESHILYIGPKNNMEKKLRQSNASIPLEIMALLIYCPIPVHQSSKKAGNNHHCP